MRTLQEVEPRILIHEADLPLTISSPGHYYLAEDISTPDGGITIESDDVSIDLRGFTLAGGKGDGIAMSAAYSNLTVVNATTSLLETNSARCIQRRNLAAPVWISVLDLWRRMPIDSRTVVGMMSGS